VQTGAFKIFLLKAVVEKIEDPKSQIQLDTAKELKADAVAALFALGCSVSEAAAALRGVPPAKAATTEERVGMALRKAGRV
jgi:Holliday junction resolvasome RuvABC DNA-binding subunit